MVRTFRARKVSSAAAARVAVGFALASALLARPALADTGPETIRIRYGAPERCPSVDEFIAQVRRFVPRLRVTFDAEPVREFTVVLQGTRGTLTIGKDGQVAGARDVEGASCAEVASVLAFAVALALDPSLQSGPSPTSPALPPAAAATPTPPASAVAAPSSSSAAPSPHPPRGRRHRARRPLRAGTASRSARGDRACAVRREHAGVDGALVGAVRTGARRERAIHEAFVRRRGIPLLRRALQSHNYLIVAWAAKGLAQIQDKQSIPLIVAAVQRAPTEYNSLIAESLVYFDDAQAQSAVDTYMPKDKATMAP